MRSADKEQNMSALVEGEDFMNLKFNIGGHRSDCFFHGDAGNLMTIAAGHSLLRFESSDCFSGEQVTMPKRQNDPEGQEWEEKEDEEEKEGEGETDDDVEDQEEWDDEDDPEDEEDDEEDDDDWEDEDDWDDEDWNEEEEDWNRSDSEEGETNDWDESDWN